MAYVDLIKKNGFKWKKQFDLVALPHINSYPYGFHLILAILSKIISLSSLERLVSPLIEVLNVLIIYYIGFYLIEIGHFEALMSGAIYIFTPAMMSTRIGPRAYNGAPRVFGQFLYLLHVCLFMLLVDVDMPILLKYGLIGISATPILLSSTFGTQVLLFFGLALLIPFPLYSISLMIAYLFGDLITWGKVTMLIRGQYEHSNAYSKVIAGTRFVYVKWYLAFLSNYKKLLTFLLACQFKDFVNYFFFKSKNKVHILIFHLPIVFSLLLLFLLNLGYVFSISYNNIDLILVTCISAALVLFFATSFYKLLFLGEAERYLEFAMPMACILVFKYFFNEESLLPYLILCYGVVFILYFHSLIRKDFESSELRYGQLNRVILDYSTSMRTSTKSRIIGLNWTSFSLLYFLQKNNIKNDSISIISTGVCVSLKLLTPDEIRMISNNTFFTSSLNSALEVICNYRVTHILSEKDNPIIEELTNNKSENMKISLSFETEIFGIYSIERI
jgi:hypothetical protein